MNTTNKQTILIVEDEPIFAEFEKDFLEECGYCTLLAFSSKDALNLVKTNSVDLILMDIDLNEKMDGTELASHILKEQDLPILFLSNRTDSETRNKAKKISCYGFISKLGDQRTLDTSIELALNLFVQKKKCESIANQLKKAHVDILQRQFAIDQHAIVAITNLAGTILYVNNRFCEISGYGYNELIGNNHRLINSGFHSKEFWKNMYSTLKSGNVWHGEIKNRAKDGTFYWVDTTIAPLENEEGKIHQYLAIRTLVTERIEAEKKLRESQAILEKQKAELEKAYSELELSQVRYFDLYDLAPVGYLTVDETGLISEANLTFALMLGTNRGAILNQPIFNFIYPDDQTTCHFHRSQLFTSAVPQSFEIRLQKTDGSIFWARFDATLRINENQTPVCRIAVTDFTKRKDLELKLQNYMNVLENINRTKDKFFNIIAHDLRNPFAGIIAISDLLEGKLKEATDEHSSLYIHYTQLIQTTSKSAFTLLENLLLWARSQTGDIKVNPTRIPIHFLISFTIPIVSGSAFKKNITIETNDTQEEYVYADESFVSTILRNLLTNAVKFTYPNGKIIVSTKKQNDFLEISVSDSGMGMDKAQLNNLFKIDSKESKLGTNKEKGSGLGLILCKDFVEKQGGKIWATSELGLGSTFTFTLPLFTNTIQTSMSSTSTAGFF